MSGHLPDKAVSGLPVKAQYRLSNAGRKPALNVSIGFFSPPASIQEIGFPARVPWLKSGKGAELTVTLLPRRRGLYVLEAPRPFSLFPFNIFRTGSKPGKKSNLLVLPHFHPLSGVNVPVGSRYQPGGIALTSNVGESPEYIGNRDYRAGDSPRRIDFHAWARTSRPVIKEYQEEYYCRVALVLDTFVPAPRRRPTEGFEHLEAAVSLSASVADALSRGEYIIDLFAAGPELYVFRGGRHIAHLDNILEILACVEHCRKDPFEAVAPALSDELASISTVIFVLLDWDHSRQNLVRTAREAGCEVKVLIVSDGAPALSADEARGPIGDVTVLSPKDIQSGALETL